MRKQVRRLPQPMCKRKNDRENPSRRSRIFMAVALLTGTMLVGVAHAQEPERDQTRVTPKPKRLGWTVEFASLPDAPRPQTIALPETSDSQQSSTASLSGTVIDRNGAALDGAHVSLTGPPGSPVRT